MAGRVVVVGAINVDLVVRASRLPGPGETVLGGDFATHFGGKGANQAVAAHRAGASVAIIGAVGRDAYGDESLANLRAEGVEVRGVARLGAPTGTALIAVDAVGQNQIVVAPGSNALLAADHVDEALAGHDADVLLASLEVPMAVVERAARLAADRGTTVVLNPAPAADLPAGLLAAGPILIPNRAELERLTGTASRRAGARRLLDAGARAVVVTLGAAGAEAYITGTPDRRRLPALAAPRVLDATGAGDTFSGVLAAWVAEGSSLDEAIRAANAAAGLSVRAHGARAGMPSRPEIEAAAARGTAKRRDA